MTERAGRFRNLTAAGAIKAILALQIGIAGLLFARDMALILPRLSLAPSAPQLTQPVRPGDQTRRYDPRHVPARPSAPGTDLPAAGDMPSRLLFEALDDNAIRISGEIGPGDATRFSDWMEGRDAPVRVQLHSAGGSVTDALDIGRAIRTAGSGTEIAKGDVCLSACPYMLAGGVERSVDPQGFVGVHQHYFGENIALPAFLAVEDIQRGQAEVMGYLDEMGIDPLLMRHALATPPDDIYILLPEQLMQYRLSTESRRLIASLVRKYSGGLGAGPQHRDAVGGANKMERAAGALYLERLGLRLARHVVQHRVDEFRLAPVGERTPWRRRRIR